jgi:hypothetical protein
MFRKIAIAAAIILAPLPALAVDLNAQITQLDGKPLIGPDGKDYPFPLGTALENSLLATTAAMSPEVKTTRFRIAAKIAVAMASSNKDQEITFTPQELTEIEKSLWENQPTLIAGQAIRIIDPTSATK